MNQADETRLAVGVHVDAPAEILLFTQYRCWMAGYETGDATCWDLAWASLTSSVPVPGAKMLYGEFHYFVRVLRTLAKRDIVWRPAACRCLCRDECLVLALVEASQRCDAAREWRYATHVLGSTDIDTLTAASRSLAQALAAQGLLLRPVRERGDAERPVDIRALH